MKKILIACFVAFAISGAVATKAQNNAGTTAVSNSNMNAGVKTKVKRGPVFRANKEQIKQAQIMLKQRGFYSGEATGKLDAETRAGLKKYQEAEGMKATGTLNRAALEKMNIALTGKQQSM